MIHLKADSITAKSRLKHLTLVKHTGVLQLIWNSTVGLFVMYDMDLIFTSSQGLINDLV